MLRSLSPWPPTLSSVTLLSLSLSWIGITHSSTTRYMETAILSMARTTPTSGCLLCLGLTMVSNSLVPQSLTSDSALPTSLPTHVYPPWACILEMLCASGPHHIMPISILEGVLTVSPLWVPHNPFQVVRNLASKIQLTISVLCFI